jgi:hypothetical protein
MIEEDIPSQLVLLFVVCPLKAIDHDTIQRMLYI